MNEIVWKYCFSDRKIKILNNSRVYSYMRGIHFYFTFIACNISECKIFDSAEFNLQVKTSKMWNILKVDLWSNFTYHVWKKKRFINAHIWNISLYSRIDCLWFSFDDVRDSLIIKTEYKINKIKNSYISRIFKIKITIHIMKKIIKLN